MILPLKKTKNPTAAKCVRHTFNLYDHRVWAAYPQELRDLYRGVLDTEVSDGRDKKMFVTEDLLRAVLHDDIEFKSMAKDMQKNINSNCKRHTEIM